ncbi:MAG: type II toxin-antitoxin system HicA family toxin [Halothece sp.]
MPRKIRELKQDLKQAGFVNIPKRGKGSHSYWEHPHYPKPIILSNKDGDDAQPYQEKQVAKAIEAVKREET